MKEMIQQFPAQLLEAIEIGKSAKLMAPQAEIRNIVIAGMGGSGIGGDFVKQCLSESLKVPVIINKGYDVPAFVDKNTLFIASSYSGNTEETLAAFNKAKTQNAFCNVITSGGKLLDIAQNEGLNYIQLPSGWSSPRACLGYSFVCQLFLLAKLDLISLDFQAEVQQAAQRLESETADIQQRANYIAKAFYQKVPIIYTSHQFSSVGLRWAQQLNENSKQICNFNVYPELNHNELVAWEGALPENAVVHLRAKSDFNRTALRMDISKEVLHDKTTALMEIYAKGASWIEQTMYLVHLGDWVSYELALLNQHDPIAIRPIDYLKNELKKY